MSDEMATREGLGFQRDADYVRKLLADPAARKRATDGFRAMSADEAEYLSDRYRVEREATAAASVVERVRDLSGGISIEDDYPDGAYVGVRVTRDLTASERQAIGQRARRYRVIRVRYSERELGKVQDALLPKNGRPVIDLQTSSVDTDRNAVVLDYTGGSITELKRRFGGRLIARRRAASRPGCRTPDRYEIARRTLTLHWMASPNGLVGPPRAEVREEGDRVLVAGVNSRTTGPIKAILLPDEPQKATATLKRPLGDRKVISILTGRAVPRNR